MSLSWLVIFFYWLPTIFAVLPCENDRIQELIKRNPVILKALGAIIFADEEIKESGAKMSSQITLAPEKIYKGVNIMKIIQPTTEGQYFEYEGQLNASLNSMEYNGRKILDLLPTYIIAFGKVDNGQSNTFKVSVNGIYKWTSLLEKKIWKYLGWSEWSDFTVCSLPCGRGIQQRFRRCLLSRGDSSFPSFPEQKLILDKNNKHKGRKIKNYDYLFKKGLKVKTYKKMFSCESYNIEQRDCNIFDCNDDIKDLLKFHKSTFCVNETKGLLIPKRGISLPQATSVGATTTTANDWKNILNFTIMITLRTKLSGRWILLSLQNSTQNFYIEHYDQELRLFQEYNDVSEMLSVPLNLSDNFWHYISFSVHNGDFISVYVDCQWKKSFVVSKRLISLPINTNIKIGRNFTGNIHQLLIIPGNYEKLQCSSKVTPIIELKTYIINSLIDD